MDEFEKLQSALSPKAGKTRVDWLKVEQDIRNVLRLYFKANIEDLTVCEAEAASFSTLLAVDRILGIATKRGCEAEENWDHGIARYEGDPRMCTKSKEEAK